MEHIVIIPCDLSFLYILTKGGGLRPFDFTNTGRGSYHNQMIGYPCSPVLIPVYVLKLKWISITICVESSLTTENLSNLCQTTLSWHKKRSDVTSPSRAPETRVEKNHIGVKVMVNGTTETRVTRISTFVLNL